MKRYENLDRAMCNELEKLDRKYAGEVGEMSADDLEIADKALHALKSGATYYAMKEAEEWDEEASGRGMPGRSYARRRDARGRYVSGDYDGWSGHWPNMPRPDYDRGDWRY